MPNQNGCLSHVGSDRLQYVSKTGVDSSGLGGTPEERTTVLNDRARTA